MTPLLVARGLTKSFGARVAVSDLSLELRPGETFALVGPNGAGKTTTLRMLAGLIAPSQGRVELNGRELTPASAGWARRPGGHPDRGARTVGPPHGAAEPHGVCAALRAAGAHRRRGRRAGAVRHAGPRARGGGPAVEGAAAARGAGADAPARSGGGAARRADVGARPRERARRARAGARPGNRGPRRPDLHPQPRRGGAAGDARGRAADAAPGRGHAAGAARALLRQPRAGAAGRARPARYAGLLRTAGVGDVRVEDRMLSVALDGSPVRSTPELVRMLVEAGAPVEEVGQETPSLEQVYLRVLEGRPAHERPRPGAVGEGDRRPAAQSGRVRPRRSSRPRSRCCCRSSSPSSCRMSPASSCRIRATCAIAAELFRTQPWSARPRPRGRDPGVHLPAVPGAAGAVAGRRVDVERRVQHHRREAGAHAGAAAGDADLDHRAAGREDPRRLRAGGVPDAGDVRDLHRRHGFRGVPRRLPRRC